MDHVIFPFFKEIASQIRIGSWTQTGLGSGSQTWIGSGPDPRLRSGSKTQTLDMDLRPDPKTNPNRILDHSDRIPQWTQIADWILD